MLFLKHNLRNNRGIAMMIVIVTVLVLTIMGGVLLAAVNNEVKSRVWLEERITARYLAEAAISQGVYALSHEINDKMNQVYGEESSDPEINLAALGEANLELDEGDMKGSFGFQLKSLEDDEDILTFRLFGIDEEVYRTVPNSDKFVITGTGTLSDGHRKFIIEAEIRLFYSLTGNRVSDYEVLEWKEIFEE
ncbi:hypothetical protein GGQ84_002518 [Desulfitispora alkaliphila]|uniref:hypothetical protein n=1 Tax=Desulfitispora alkaliphila TaxID=622674 RepID=UPI003D1C2944